MHVTQGWVHLHVRTWTRADVPPFPYLGNGRPIGLKFGLWLELCVLQVLRVERILRTHVRTPFHILIAAQLCSEFGALLDTH